MRGAFYLTGGLLCLSFLGGCLYCAYPKIDYTPGVKIDAPSSEVHIFRVDSTKDGVLPFAGLIHVPADQLLKWNESSTGLLSELPKTEEERVPAQFKTSLSYGLAVPILVVNALTHTTHSMSLRLYRRGYDLIEIKSWQKHGQIVWKPVPDLEAQENVLDALLADQRLVGSASPAHRDALQFVAVEYERLAAATQSPDHQSRLVGKASKLREGAKE